LVSVGAAPLSLASAGDPEGDGSPAGAAGDAEIHAATPKHIATYSVVCKSCVAVHGGKRERERWFQVRNPKKKGFHLEEVRRDWRFPSPGPSSICFLEVFSLKEKLRETNSRNVSAFY